MIAALAKASRVFQKSSWLDAAIKATEFIESHLIVDGRLMARYRNGEIQFKAYLDDYAILLWAYIELYEATFDLDFLRKAKTLAGKMISLFWDKENHGFYFYGNDAESLIVRPKDVYDGALPSGNSVAALQLIKLAKFTGDTTYEEMVHHMHLAFAKDIKRYPSGYLSFLQSFLFARTETKEVILLGGKKDNEQHEKLLKTIQASFMPEVTWLVADDSEAISDLAPFANDFHLVNQKPTIYVCQHFTCRQPTNEIEKTVNQFLDDRC